MQRRFFAWALLGMLLSGCGGTPYDDQNPAVDKRSMPPPVPGETWAARAPMDFTFKGKQANAGPDWPRQIRPSEMFSNGTKLAKALRLYSNFELTEKPGKRIGDIRSAASRPAALKGLGGLYGESLLDAADSSLTGGGHFNSAKRTTMLISGQIAHYEYNPCPAPNTGNGKLVVYTQVKRINTPLGSGASQTKVEQFAWEIEVEDCGFKVVARDDSLANLFDVPMELSEDARERIRERNYRFKLWAQGNAVKIKHIWRKRNVAAAWQRLPEGANRHLYDADPDSCIDMLFASQPPRTLPSGAEPPFYCLGRCASPMIVNTGE